MRQFLFVIIFSLLFSQISYSQEVWTFKKCVEYAFENNITLKQSELNVQYQKQKLSQSKAERYPNLNANASHNFNYGHIVDPFTNEFSENNVQSTSLSINSSVVLFGGLENYRSLQKSRLNLLAAYQSNEEVKNDLALSIANLYLELIFQKENTQNAQNKLQLSQQNLEKTKLLVETGKLPESNLYEAQAQVANDELQLINFRNAEKRAVLNLKNLLDLEYSAAFDVLVDDNLDVLLRTQIPSPDSIFQQALKLPEIQKAQYMLESSQEQIKITRSAYSPTLVFSAGYGTGYSSAREKYTMQLSGVQEIGYVGNDPSMLVYSPAFDRISENYSFTEQFKDNASTSFGFRLTVPIFNRLQTKTTVEYAKIEKIRAEYELEQEKNTLYEEIQQAHNEALAATSSYQAALKSYNANKKSLEYAQIQFELGMLNNYDFNSTQNRLNSSFIELNKAKYQCIFSYSVIDFYLGSPITIK